MALRLDCSAAQSISSAHTQAGTAIGGTSGSMPVGVDGGLGEPHLLAILSAMATSAAGLGRLAERAGAQVQAAAHDAQSTEAVMARTFTRQQRVLGR